LIVINTLRKLRSRTWVERGLLLEALFLLGLMRVAILLFPFQRVARWLKLEPNETQTSQVSGTWEVSDRIGWAVRASAARAPWQSACLVQALAGMVMLKRRKLPAALILAVTKNGVVQEGFAAHAWLRCGEVVLTGEEGHEHYKVITTFTVNFEKNL